MKVQNTPSGFQPGVGESQTDGSIRGYRGAPVQPDLPAQTTSRVFSPTSDLGSEIHPEGTTIDRLADRLARHLERLLQWFERAIGRNPRPPIRPGGGAVPQSEPIETFPFLDSIGSDVTRPPKRPEVGDGLVTFSNPIETLPVEPPPGGEPDIGGGIVQRKSTPIETFPGPGEGG